MNGQPGNKFSLFSVAQSRLPEMGIKHMVTQLAATAEQLQARLGLRSSSAAARHKNKKAAEKHPGKGNRNNWKREL